VFVDRASLLYKEFPPEQSELGQDIVQLNVGECCWIFLWCLAVERDAGVLKELSGLLEK
jgi:hypothetical protein